MLQCYEQDVFSFSFVWPSCIPNTINYSRFYSRFFSPPCLTPTTRSPALGFSSAAGFDYNHILHPPPNVTCTQWEVLPMALDSSCIAMTVPQLPTLLVSSHHVVLLDLFHRCHYFCSIPSLPVDSFKKMFLFYGTFQNYFKTISIFCL
jgi:hypothetical protein